jgi:hypothetical protein
MSTRWIGTCFLWHIFAAAACFLRLLATGISLALAGDEGRASGQFASNGTQLKIKDAYAFRTTPSPGGADGKEKVIVVAVSNDGFIPAAIDEYWDRRNVLDRHFRDESTILSSVWVAVTEGSRITSARARGVATVTIPPCSRRYA